MKWRQTLSEKHWTGWGLKRYRNLHKQFAQSDEIFWKIIHVWISSSIKLEFMVFLLSTFSFTDNIDSKASQGSREKELNY